MTIQTKFHGEIQIEQENIYTFPQGIPGFEDEEKWVILPIKGNDVFQVLQSTSTAELALIVMNPYTMLTDYNLKIDEPTIELLQIEKQEEVFILTVVTMREPFEQSTMNLQAPLIFNARSKQAKQMIVGDESFNRRHPLQAKGEA